MSQNFYTSIEELREPLSQENQSKILVFTGSKSFEDSGASSRLSIILPKETFYFKVTEDKPELNGLLRAIEFYKQANPDMIIAIGGGKIIDTAKIVKGLYTAENLKKCIEENKGVVDNGEKLIAIPTTSGSGSESTPFAVAYVDGIKYSLQDDSLLPSIIVLDASLTCNLSPRQTAISGMDALAQGIESYWSINSTDKSKEYSRQAIELALSNLEKTVNNPSLDSRKSMMLASNLAGRAIAIAKTTACHSLSYPMTSRFGIPHGHAVGMTLGSIFTYNTNVNEKNCNDKRGVEYVKKTMRELKDVGLSEDKLYKLMKDIRLETKFSELGIDEAGIDRIVEEGFNPQRMKNNPAMPSREDARKILMKRA